MTWNENLKRGKITITLERRYVLAVMMALEHALHDTGLNRYYLLYKIFQKALNEFDAGRGYNG